MIAGVLLAAGKGSRFGGDKMTALLGGAPMVRCSLRAIEALDDVIVVTGSDRASVAGALKQVRARVVSNADPASGMSGSIRVGIGALPLDAEAMVIALGDQPFARAAVTDTLVNRWKAGDADIVVPRYRDGRGHPVLFGRACFPALMALEGDRGARSVLDSGAWRVAVVDVAGDMPMDVDTPAALALAASRAADEASHTQRPR